MRTPTRWPVAHCSVVVILILAAVGSRLKCSSRPPISANSCYSRSIEVDSLCPQDERPYSRNPSARGDAFRGDIIAVLDDEQLRARVEQAQAELQQAEARPGRTRPDCVSRTVAQEEANVAQQEAATTLPASTRGYTRLAKSEPYRASRETSCVNSDSRRRCGRAKRA